MPDVVRANELKRISQINDTKARLIKPEQEEFNAVRELSNNGEFANGGDLNDEYTQTYGDLSWLSTPRHMLLNDQELNRYHDLPEINADFLENGYARDERIFKKQSREWSDNLHNRVTRDRYDFIMDNVKSELTPRTISKESSIASTTPIINNSRIKQGFDMTIPSIKNSQIKYGRSQGRFNSKLFNSTIPNNESTNSSNQIITRPNSPRVIPNVYDKSMNMELDNPTIDSTIPNIKTKNFKSSNPSKEGIGTYAGDIINTGLALYESFRTPTQYPGVQLTPTPSYRRLNPYGRIGGISNEVSKAMKDIDLSTSNSQVSRAAKQNVLLAGMDAKNKYLSEIEDKNVANDNQFASMSANINANNAASINANNLGRYSVNEARRDNLINMYSGIGASISNKLIDKRNFNSKLALDKEINKINTESGERIANINSDASTKQMEYIKNMGDVGAYLKLNIDQYTDDEAGYAKFSAEFPHKSESEKRAAWNRVKTPKQ